jgi:phospholipase/carboxylesterase
LLLHGVGSNEEDLFGLEGSFDPRWLVISARAPLTLRPGSYAWFQVQFGADGPLANAVQAEASRKIVVQFVGWAVAEYGADANRVLVAGFSQGAIMAASLALTEPEKTRAVALMSGRILPEVLPLAASPERRAKTSYLVVHGTLDEVLPIRHGRESRETLRSLGLEPEYHEFAMPHTVTDESLATVVAWAEGRVGLS